MDAAAQVLNSFPEPAVPINVSKEAILDALAGSPSPIYTNVRISAPIVIRSQFLQGIQPHIEDTLERGISEQERQDRFQRNEKQIYNFSILDKVISALGEHPEQSWPMRRLLTDVLAIVNLAPYKSIQFFLLAHLAFRYEKVIEVFGETVNFEPSEEVEIFMLPARNEPEGRELSLLESIFVEMWMLDFQAWILSPAVVFG